MNQGGWLARLPQGGHYAPASCGAGVPAMRSKVGPRVGLAPVASVGVACPGLGGEVQTGSVC